MLRAVQLLPWLVAGAALGTLWVVTRPADKTVEYEAYLTVPPDEVDIDAFQALMEFVLNNEVGIG